METNNKSYCQLATCPRHELRFRPEVMKHIKQASYDFVFCSLKCHDKWKLQNQKEISKFEESLLGFKQTTRRKHDKK